MAEKDHREAIRRLVSAGKLEAALETLRDADEQGRKTGLDVLIPLARALLEEGREQETLEILGRASSFAAFGGNLRHIATDLGFPSLEPSSSQRETVESHPFGPEADTEMGGFAPADESSRSGPRSASGAASSDPLDDFDTPLQPRKVDALATVESQVDLLALGGADSGQTGEEVNDTDRVPMPSHHRRDESDTDKVPMPAGAALEGPDDADTDEVPLAKRSDEDQADTDEVAMPRRGTEASGPTSTTPTAPTWPDRELDSVRKAGDAAIKAQIRWTTSATTIVDRRIEEGITEERPPDAPQAPEVDDDERETRSIDLNGLKDQKPKRRQRDTIKDIARQARALRERVREVTAKLLLRDVEIVGTFEAGSRRAPPSYQPSLFFDEPSHEIDFSQVPNSEDLVERDELLPPSEPDDEPIRRETSEPEPEPEPDLRATRPMPAATAAPERRREAPARTGRRSSKRRALVPIAAVTGVVLLGVLGFMGWKRRARANQLDQVREVLTDDTFESHRQAVAILAELSNRSGGDACGEFAVESAMMWGRFGLGQEHGEASTRALASCPEAAAREQGYLARALLALYQNEPARGASLGEEGVEAFPESGRLHAALAWNLESLGRIEEALAELNRAYELDPDYIPATLSLARLHRRAGRRGEARLLLDEIRGASPRHVEARAEEMMLDLDTCEEAMPAPAVIEELRTQASSLEAAAQGQPPAIVAAVALARGRFALLQGNVEHAGVLLGRAWRRGTTSPEATLHVARGLRLAGDLRRAIEVSGTLPGEAPEMTLEKVRVWLAAGRPAPALAELRALRELDLQDGAAAARLEARALAQKGDLVAASDLLERQLRRGPDDETRFLYGELTRRRGDWMKAAEIMAAVTGRPWSTCAEAFRREAADEYDHALQAITDRTHQRTPCALRLKSLLSKQTGDHISEISALRSLMRAESRFDDRLTLVRAVWRERGANAALTELRSVLEAPPTGLRPLLTVVETLATMRAELRIDRLLRDAEEAGADQQVLATARARAARLAGRPEEALEVLRDLPDEPITQALIERGAALVALRRSSEALAVLERVEVEPGSTDWVFLVDLTARATRERRGAQESLAVLDRALRRVEMLGNRDVVRELALTKVELNLMSKANPNEIRSQLRLVPSSPPDPRLFHLTGKLAELQGNRETAIDAYRQALDVDPAHIPSLERLVALTDAPEYRRGLSMLLVPAGDGGPGGPS